MQSERRDNDSINPQPDTALMSEIRTDLNFTASDVRNAGADYIGRRLGIPASGRDHPSADDLADARVTLGEMASMTAHRSPTANKRTLTSNSQRVVAGMSSDDFAEALGEGMRRVAFRSYDEESDHRRLSRRVEVPNFHPADLPVLDINTDLARIREGAEFRHQVHVNTSNETATLQSYGAIIGISRQTILRDDVGIITEVIGSMGAAASRLEAVKTYTIFNTNPNLNDGSALFGAGNSISTAPLSKAKLGEAVGKLRNQTGPSGNIANIQPRYLVVESELEIEARSIIAEVFGTSNRSIEVVPAPWLDSGYWFVMGDPDRWPVLTRAVLQGSSRSLSVMRARQNIINDATRFKVVADLDVKAVGRVGIVRASKT